MHTVIWTIQPNEGTSRNDIELELDASKSDYADGKGLVRAMFGVAADNKSVIEISLWESKSAADAFFTMHWETNLSQRWQAAPISRQDLQTVSTL